MYCVFFLKNCDLPLHFLTDDFNEQKFLMLMMSNVSIFSFTISPFCVLRNLCLPQGPEDILLVFFPEAL